MTLLPLVLGFPLACYLMAAGQKDNISLHKIIVVNPCPDQEHDADDVSGQFRERLFGVLRSDHEDRGVIELAGQKAEDFVLSRFSQSARLFRSNPG